MDHVAIALPTYNRPERLDRALTSLRAQTHPDLSITVFDNASTNPDVYQIVSRHMEQDDRIQLVKRQTNIGIVQNFRRAIIGVNAPFFMWAADDDYWHPEFIAHLVKAHKLGPPVDLTFGGVEFDNLQGALIGRINDFSRFDSTQDSLSDLARFVAEPETGGKVNIMYGLFRTEALKETLQRLWDKKNEFDWGDDIVLMTSFLASYRFRGTTKTLFRKTIQTRSMRGRDFSPVWYSRGPGLHGYKGFRERLVDAVDSEEQKTVVADIIDRRIFQESFLAPIVRPPVKLYRHVKAAFDVLTGRFRRPQ